VEELIDDSEFGCWCEQVAQAAALSGHLFGTAGEAPSQMPQVKNFAGLR
jgi:hypothetical protein